MCGFATVRVGHIEYIFDEDRPSGEKFYWQGVNNPTLHHALNQTPLSCY